MRGIPWAALLLCACRGESKAPNAEAKVHGSDDHFVLSGGQVVRPDGISRQDIEVRGGRIVALGQVDPNASRIDISGKFVTAAVIDSHVHLAYLPRAEEMARGGVAGAVDLGAPRAFLQSLLSLPLQIIAAGPMITAPAGYPTQSWGSAGYGLEVDSPNAAGKAADSLLAAGARVIKVPIGEAPTLDDATLTAVVGRAHAAKLPVVAHALGNDDAARAALLGVDALAHTPLEPLSESTLDAWKGRAVISTLSAFGGSDARSNLAALHQRGVTVLYGTDFGNTSRAGISAAEIDALLAAGLSGSDILRSATEAPAKFFGFDGLGSVEVGIRASLLLFEQNPLEQPTALATPEVVFRDGERL